MTRATLQEKIYELKGDNPDADNAIIRELVISWFDDFNLADGIFSHEESKARLESDLDSYEWELPEEEEEV